MDLALAALVGGLLGAPAWVLAWEFSALGREWVCAVLRVVVLRRRDHSRTLPRVSMHIRRQGRHATPRYGTPVITGAVASAPTTKELAA